MKNNTIKIKAFLCLLLLTCGWVSVQAQQVLTVKGVVVDALKEPLSGASVQVVGMSTGTVTDLDGNFLSFMAVPPANRSLIQGGHYTASSGLDADTSRTAEPKPECNSHFYCRTPKRKPADF